MGGHEGPCRNFEEQRIAARGTILAARSQNRHRRLARAAAGPASYVAPEVEMGSYDAPSKNFFISASNYFVNRCLEDFFEPISVFLSQHLQKLSTAVSLFAGHGVWLLS